MGWTVSRRAPRRQRGRQPEDDPTPAGGRQLEGKPSTALRPAARQGPRAKPPIMRRLRRPSRSSPATAA